MSKFTFREKQLAVNLYLQGVSSDKIVNDLNIASRSQLLFWVKQYKKYGANALKEKKRHQEYDVEFKLEVLDWKAKNKASYEATALHFGISSSSIIYKWHKLDAQGALATPKRRGRPRKSLESMTPEERELKILRDQNQALLQEINRLKKAKEEMISYAR